jgi:hypothetical protein
MLDRLYWLIDSAPQPNWRETYPIWSLARYGDTPSHVAWKIWDGLFHYILYSIDEENAETIIRSSGVTSYPHSLPRAGMFD